MPSSSSSSSSSSLNTLKTKVLSHSIDEDQAFIAQIWEKTFRGNEEDDKATSIAKLMLACVAKGDFKVRSSLVGNDLTNPPHGLHSIDYLSHASRLIIDYKQLSPQYQAEFLSFFPPQSETVISRSATHAVTRQNDKVVELKGLILGVAGQLPACLRAPKDFGINIAGSPTF